MNRFLTAACFPIFILVTASLVAEEKIVISAHSDYPPIMWYDGKQLLGVGVKMAETVFQELKIPYEIKYVDSWKRVQVLAEKGKIDVISSLYMNDERRKYLDFSIPFLDDPTSVWVQKGKRFEYKNWDSLIGKRGVTLLGDSFGEELDKFIVDKLTIDRVYDMQASFKRLSSGKADYILWGYFACRMYSQKNGYDDKIELLNRDIRIEKMYMGFSKKSKFKELLPKVNHIIEKLIKQGKVQEWSDYYMDYYSKHKSGSAK